MAGSRSKLPPDPRDREIMLARIKELYEAGAGVRFLASQFNVGYGTMYRYLDRAGAKRRTPGRPPLEQTVEFLDAILADYEIRKLPVSSIAREREMSVPSVVRYLKRARASRRARERDEND